MNEAQPTRIAALFAAPDEAHGTVDPVGDPEENLARLRAMAVDKIVLEYLGVRDRLDEERGAWQRTEADLKGQLATMSMVLREKADSIGVDAFPIRGLGTAYRNSKTSYRIVDWAGFTEWLDRTKNFHCLEKRVAKLAIAEVEREMEAVPPGVDKTVEVEFLVRRNKA